MSYDNQHDYDQSFRAQAEEAMRAEMMENMEGRINKLIEEVTGCTPEEITPNARFYSDLDCDSLDGVEIMMKTELEFSVSLPDDTLGKVQSVQQYYDLVESILHNHNR